MIRLKKDRIQINEKLRHDSIVIKIAGIDQLSKEAALIKTHEIAKDLPEAKLFDKIVKIIHKRKILVEILLSKGADPNIKNNFGNTALHMAYKNDNAFIINILIEYGADEKLKNNKYLLPWQMSKYLN